MIIAKNQTYPFSLTRSKKVIVDRFSFCIKYYTKIVVDVGFFKELLSGKYEAHQSLTGIDLSSIIFLINKTKVRTVNLWYLENLSLLRLNRLIIALDSYFIKKISLNKCLIKTAVVDEQTSLKSLWLCFGIKVL